MFFPRVYSNKILKEDENDDEEGNKTALNFETNGHESLGRLVVFFFGKFFVACLLSEQAIATLYVSEIKKLIEKRGKEMTCRQVKASWICDTLDRMAKGGGLSSSSVSNINASDPSAVPSQDGTIDYPGFHADLFRIQSLFVVSKLHKILKSELDNGEGSASTAATNSASGSGKEANSFRRDPNAMLVANTPSPAMVRASIHTKSFLEREMKVLGFLPNGTIVRVSILLPLCDVMFFTRILFADAAIRPKCFSYIDVL